MFIQTAIQSELWKRRSVKAFTAAALLLMLPCIFMIIRPNRVYRCEQEYVFEEGTAAEAVAVYHDIVLKPGVYLVELYYDAVSAETGPIGYTTVEDGTVITGGLRTNGEHLYAGSGRTGYHMWLYEGADSMRMLVSYNGSGAFRLSGYTITETNQLWTMLIVILAAVYLAVLLGISFLPHCPPHLFFVLLIGLTASLPYCYRGVFGGADLTYHLQRIEGVKDGLISGQFPVRLEPEWLYGHGYADAIFYCNALFYLPALLRLAGFTVSAAYNIYAIALSLLTAWIAWYCFQKIFENNTIGLICSGLYTLSVFRVSRFVFTATVGEGSAFAFMPLVIYGLYRVLTEDTEAKDYRTAWLPVAIGYAGLMQTHVLSCEIAAGLTLLLCLVCIRRVLRGPVFLQLLKGALGALGLSLWFLVPFLDYYLTQDVHIKHVSGRLIQERGIALSDLIFHFWKTETQGTSSEAGISLILVLGLAGFWALYFGGQCGKAEKKKLRLALITAAFGLLLLVMSLRVFPWDAIHGWNRVCASLVSSLQIPYRVLGWATACLVTVFGFCLHVLFLKDRRLYHIALFAAVTGILLSGVFLLNRETRRHECIELYNEEGMGCGYISGAEYLIEGTDENLLTYTGPKPGAAVTLDAYRKRGLRAEMYCRNSSESESYVDLPILLYKGYRAKDAASGEKLAVRDGENHVARVVLPAGYEGELTVEFKSPAYWRISEIISILAMIFLAAQWQKSTKRGVESAS